MLSVEITTSPQGHVVLMAKGLEIIIFDFHLKKLKALKEPVQFAQYFLQNALINRATRKLFEAWLKADKVLWQKLYKHIQSLDIQEEAVTTATPQTEIPNTSIEQKEAYTDNKSTNIQTDTAATISNPENIQEPPVTEHLKETSTIENDQTSIKTKTDKQIKKPLKNKTKTTSATKTSKSGSKKVNTKKEQTKSTKTQDKKSKLKTTKDTKSKNVNKTKNAKVLKSNKTNKKNSNIKSKKLINKKLEDKN